MIQTVLEHESFLFNDEEKDLIARFAQMSCMYVRYYTHECRSLKDLLTPLAPCWIQ
jgi:hypothetical protein